MHIIEIMFKRDRTFRQKRKGVNCNICKTQVFDVDIYFSSLNEKDFNICAFCEKTPEIIEHLYPLIVIYKSYDLQDKVRP